MQPYSASAVTRAIILATILASTLYLLGAFTFAIMAGGSPIGVLRGICGAIIDPDLLGHADDWTGTVLPPLIGLLLHFALMTVIAAIYVSVASHIRLVNRLAELSGVGYGLVLWAVMYWYVLPRRWPTLFPVTGSIDVAMQLFSHIVLVGIPIALVARSAARWR